MASKLSNQFELDEIRTAALAGMQGLDVSKTSDSEIKNAISNAREIALYIVKSFQDDFEKPNKLLKTTLENINEITWFFANGDEDKQDSIIDVVGNDIQKIILDPSDYNILISAYVLATLALRTERDLYENFGAKILLSDEPVLRAMQEEEPEKRIERLTHEIKDISSVEQLGYSIVKIINLADLVKNQTNDEDIKHAAKAVIELSGKQFNVSREFDMSRKQLRQFDIVQDLISKLPEGNYKEALSVAFVAHLQNYALNVNLRATKPIGTTLDISKNEAIIEESISATIDSVVLLQELMKKNLISITEPYVGSDSFKERNAAIESAYANAKQLNEFLQSYRINATVFEIDPELVKEAQDTLDGALAVCKCVAKTWGLTFNTAHLDPDGSKVSRRSRRNSI